ncbi:MAG: alpha-amylase [Bacteroidales bacterium]|nr:alpha-amylase [Bacteroidales bacterium]
MKKWICCIVLALVALGAQAFENVSAARFAELIAFGGVQVVDVRTAEEYADGHIPGSILIDVRQESFRAEASVKLSASVPVAVYCRSGVRGRNASGILEEAGFRVYNLDGGILEWMEAGLSVETGAQAKKYPEWLDRAVFYQIYPSSYMDSDGNGIGDIPGITSKLDYIKSIGVNAIWLNPVYESGWMDGGYDVIDYYKVDPRFGTNTDMVTLIREAHKRGIKVIMDLVAGHTSNQNAWFLQSMEADPNQRYSDYYIWTDEISEKDKEDIAERYRQPNPQSSTIGNFVEKNAPRAKYYYKNYYEAQPALNYGFANPDPNHPWEQSIDAPGPKAVWQELQNIMVFWFDKGADGFRVDMAQSLIKNDKGHVLTSQKWRSLTSWIHEHYPDNVLLAEWSDPEISLPAGFDIDFFLPWRSATGYTKLILPEPYGQHATNYFNKAGKGEVREFVDYYSRTVKTLSQYGYMAPQTSNHDVQRPNILTRNTLDQLKVAITFFLTLKSIPFIYYGDEIGMKYNPDAPEKEGSREVFSSGFVNERAGSRTPMQWTAGPNAGFSTCAPEDLFLPVDTDGGALTVEAQDADPNSLLNHVRRILALRQDSPAMSNTGDWEYVSDPDQPYPMVYKRFAGDELYLIALNPSGKKVSAEFPTLGRSRAEAFTTVGKTTFKAGKTTDRITLNPVSAVIYRMDY